MNAVVKPHDTLTDPIKTHFIERPGSAPITRYTAPSGRNFTVGEDPHPNFKSAPGDAAKSVITEWRRLETIAHNNGGELPDLAHRTQALDVIRAARTELSTETARIDTDEEALYAPPRPADAAEALEDREVRDYLETLTGEARTRVMMELSGRMALACVRSPRPLPGFREKAVAMHREHVAEMNPDVVEQVRRRRESVKWAGIAIDSLQRLVSAIPVKAKR